MNVNENNLYDLKQDMTLLGAAPETIELMEKRIREGSLSFEILESQKVANGYIETIFPFKTSDPEKGYFFRSFKSEFHKIKPLKEGQSYFLITPKENGKNDVKKFDHPLEAIRQFKKRDKDCELSVGNDVAHNSMVAKKTNNVEVVGREYRAAFYGTSIDQTFYNDQGKGFTVKQAGNLVLGRAVYRDDLVAYGSGERYKAWVTLDMEKGKTGQNFQFKPYRDPNYGFDVNAVVKNFSIDGIEKEEKLEQLVNKLKDGERVMVNANKNGEKIQVYIEPAVRYRQLNFFKPDGTPEKREEFLTPEAKERIAQINLSKEKEKQHSNAQGIGI